MKFKRRKQNSIAKEIDDQIYQDELMYIAITDAEKREEEYEREYCDMLMREIENEYRDRILYDDYLSDMYMDEPDWMDEQQLDHEEVA